MGVVYELLKVCEVWCTLLPVKKKLPHTTAFFLALTTNLSQ
jgi:hypothetical protein